MSAYLISLINSESNLDNLNFFIRQSVDVYIVYQFE